MKDSIDADRPFLEQWEEALKSDDDLDWLDKHVYGNPEAYDAIRTQPIGVDWFEKIPSQLAARIDGLKIRAAGFGAGPSFVAQKFDAFDPPLPLEYGAQWLDRWRGIFKMARLVLEEGTTLYFDSSGFIKEGP